MISKALPARHNFDRQTRGKTSSVLTFPRSPRISNGLILSDLFLHYWFFHRFSDVSHRCLLCSLMFVGSVPLRPMSSLRCFGIQKPPLLPFFILFFIPSRCFYYLLSALLLRGVLAVVFCSSFLSFFFVELAGNVCALFMGF